MTKSKALVGNMVIAQSGGPTMVINQSLVGAVLEAKKHKSGHGSAAQNSGGGSGAAHDHSSREGGKREFRRKSG